MVKKEEVMKCFSCSSEAVAMVNYCSPTSTDSLTPTRPCCEECLANMRGVNIVSLLISQEEFDKRMAALVKNKHGLYLREVVE